MHHSRDLNRLTAHAFDAHDTIPDAGDGRVTLSRADKKSLHEMEVFEPSE